MSVFAPRDRYGHVLAHYELAPCELHKNHQVFICRMRRGSKVCGEVEVLPPYTPACNEKTDNIDR